VQGNSSIKTAKDLEGKTVAVNQLNNGTQVAAEQWMQRHGGDPSKVHFTELALPQELPSLLHGQIDAAIVGEPFTTIGKSMGARVLVYQYTALRKKTVLGGIVALQPWAAAHKNLVQRFAKAVNEGEAWTHKHPALARAYLTKYVNMDPSVAAKIPLDILDKLRPADLSYWVRLGLNWHVLTTGINVKQLIWPTAAT
jgi:NitT/TauT family transport system substrate-binding protein